MVGAADQLRKLLLAVSNRARIELIGSLNQLDSPLEIALFRPSKARAQTQTCHHFRVVELPLAERSPAGRLFPIKLGAPASLVRLTGVRKGQHSLEPARRG